MQSEFCSKWQSCIVSGRKAEWKNLKSEQNRLRFILEDSKEAREDNLPTLQRLRELMQSLESGQAMLNERISSLYEFIEKSHDEMHAMVNGSDIPESPFLDDSL